MGCRGSLWIRQLALIAFCLTRNGDSVHGDGQRACLNSMCDLAVVYEFPKEGIWNT
jgi:hypothetical protein